MVDHELGSLYESDRFIERYNWMERKLFAVNFGKKVIYKKHKIVKRSEDMAVDGVIARLFVMDHRGVRIDTMQGKYLGKR